MASFEREVMNRLVRVESKLVRGFEELGVNIDKDNDWLTVDDNARVIYVSTLGRSLTVMLTDMGRNGATHVDKEYEIIHKGEVVGTVMFRPTY
jgi:predicted RNA-binding protein with PUA domain